VIEWIYEQMKPLTLATMAIAFVLLVTIVALDRGEPEQADDFEECDNA